jgi:hypothetical protein
MRSSNPATVTQFLNHLPKLEYLQWKVVEAPDEQDHNVILEWPVSRALQNLRYLILPYAIPSVRPLWTWFKTANDDPPRPISSLYICRTPREIDREAMLPNAAKTLTRLEITHGGYELRNEYSKQGLREFLSGLTELKELILGFKDLSVEEPKMQVTDLVSLRFLHIDMVRRIS